MLKDTVILVLLIGAVAMQFFTVPAYAQISETRLTASDAGNRQDFGSSVSISGDILVVGARSANAGATSLSGAAYAYVLGDTGWVEEFKLFASDATEGDRFGWVVSLSGEDVIIGAARNAENGTNAGAAYIFKRDVTNWTEEAKLLPPEVEANDDFGFSVSISGDYAIVGANNDDDAGTNSGAAYIFKRTGANWAQEAKLVASNAAFADNFGWSVAISGDYAVVGANRKVANQGDFKGAAYVFMRTDAIWTEQAFLLASDGALQDEFGTSVSISGDYVAVGSRDYDSTTLTIPGSVYIFKRTGTNWAEEEIIIPADREAWDSFGKSVSLSGDSIIVIGAPHNLDNSVTSGAAYVFKRSGTDWIQEQKLIASDIALSDEFGLSVSISGNNVVVGAENESAVALESGSVYVFGEDNTPVGVENERALLPARIALKQNYPNPFNPTTTIKYDLTQSHEVNLMIYNILGEEVARLVDGFQSSGEHTAIWNASNVTSGIYFYRLQAGDFIETRKMVLLK